MVVGLGWCVLGVGKNFHGENEAPPNHTATSFNLAAPSLRRVKESTAYSIFLISISLDSPMDLILFSPFSYLAGSLTLRKVI